MKILLACSAGMSTSLLESSIQKYAKENNLDITCLAVPTFSARQMFMDYDVVLLGPQVRFELPKFKALMGNRPLGVIPGDIYAMGKGKETIELAKKVVADAQK